MKSNLSRWGLSRYYITKEGILYFKTLNKGWVKKLENVFINIMGIEYETIIRSYKG